WPSPASPSSPAGAGAASCPRWWRSGASDDGLPPSLPDAERLEARVPRRLTAVDGRRRRALRGASVQSVHRRRDQGRLLGEARPGGDARDLLPGLRGRGAVARTALIPY